MGVQDDPGIPGTGNSVCCESRGWRRRGWRRRGCKSRGWRRRGWSGKEEEGDWINILGLPQPSTTPWEAKNSRNFLSQFWRPEVQNQSVSRASLPLKPIEGSPSLPPLVSGICWHCQAFLSLQMHHSHLCFHLHVVCLCVQISFVLQSHQFYRIKGSP